MALDRGPGASAQHRFDRASRALALRLDGRPAHIVRPEVALRLLAEAEAAATELDAILTAGDRGAAVPAQVARQRIAGWRPAVQRAVAAAESATAADVALAGLLTRARLMLHRYARHFGGQHRATRDLGRLSEARVDLVALTRAAQPLALVATDADLKQEARALPRFIEFLVQEQGEITDNLAASGRLDQARALGAIAATLEDGWLAEVRPVHRLARRPALLLRYLQSVAEVVDRMGAIRHANLPEAHERAIVTVGTWQRQWQDEYDQTVAEQARAGVVARRVALAEHAAAQWRDVEAELAAGEAEPALVEQLRARCDCLDEVWVQLSEPPMSDALDGHGGPELVDLRDALIWLGQRYDQLAAPA